MATGPTGLFFLKVSLTSFLPGDAGRRKDLGLNARPVSFECVGSDWIC